MRDIGLMKKAKSDDKRRNAAASRMKILVAAQKVFADVGFGESSMRQIARMAEVDAALIHHYFGTKAALFEEALSTAIEPFQVLAAGDRSNFGELLSAELLSDFFDITAQSMILLSASHPEASRAVARVLKDKDIVPGSAEEPLTDTQVRAVRLLMLASGFALFTRQIRLLSPEQATSSGCLDWLSTALQSVIDD